MSWVPLHVHSQYSILDSTASISSIVKKAVEQGMSAVALTDQGNLYGAIEFYKACKAAKIKPILGCELFVAPGSRKEKKKSPNTPHGYPIILLAKNLKGYENLCKLSSLAFLEGFYYTPRIDKELLQKHHEGLVCLSGNLQSYLAALAVEGKEVELLEEALWYKSLFGEDFYLEVQRHPMKDEDIRMSGIEDEPWLYQRYYDYVKKQESIITSFRLVSEKTGIKCVATNDSHYIDPEDWKAHEILMNVQSGTPCEIWEKDSFGNNKRKMLNPKRDTLSTHELYFKSPSQIKELFSDFPEAVAVTLEIAEECSLSLDFTAKYYPVYVPPHLEGKQLDKEQRTQEAADYLRHLCHEGVKKRYTPEKLAKVQEKYPGRDPLDVVYERLKYELEIIIPKGMCDYLLIVYDFINWAKRRGIPMGPGRGSGAGSIILYLIEITDIEPLRFNLFFERFINPERISYPDIDVDICMDRRAEVIDYTVEKYGKDKVAQIITFGTMKAKMAIKDVGRVLNVPLAKVNAIAKLVPEDPTITLEKALEVDPELRQQYESDEEVHRLMDFAKKLEGCVRNTGIHAAGLIICGDPIMDHIPVCSAKDSDIVATQFSMKPVESVGMLKIDFLGLKTLTSIQKAVNALKASRGIDIDWINISLENKATFDLLNQGKTLGIFQLESGGMQDLAKQLQIDKFEEIIAVGALYRPGPMEMIPSFIQRKHGKEAIEIDHPHMHDILSETYGIMVYQEQVMQIASKLANYTLGEGDVLRRAMGKKDKEEMNKQREKFRLGALQNGIDEETSMRIFDKVEKFASYGFNKSHAAAYGFLTYVTAFLKANYPSEWMAALMTCDRDDLTKVAKIIRECQIMNISILPPDINESDEEFVATSSGIRFAMTAIKGVGEGVVEMILQDRKKAGHFTSLFQFFQRMDVKKIGKKVIEYLIEAGCFDFTGWSRQAMVESVDPMFSIVSRQQEETAKGVMHLFSFVEEENRFTVPPPSNTSIPRDVILRREKELLGFYLTGHPMDTYRTFMQRLSCVPLAEIGRLPHDSVYRIAGIIETVQIKISAKSQRKFAILSVGDGFERIEIPVWPDLYEEKTALLVENQLIYAVLHSENREGNQRLNVKWIDDLTRADEAMISTCDTLCEKVKGQVKKAEHSEKYRQNSSKEKSMEKKTQEVKISPSKLVVKLDANLTRHSHILDLKNIFYSFHGSTPIYLQFYGNESKSIATIEITSLYGVSYSQELEKALQSLTFIKEICLEELKK